MFDFSVIGSDEWASLQNDVAALSLPQISFAFTVFKWPPIFSHLGIPPISANIEVVGAVKIRWIPFPIKLLEGDRFLTFLTFGHFLLSGIGPPLSLVIHPSGC